MLGHIFNSGNGVLGEAFTHTPTLKKWIKSYQQAKSSFTESAL